MARRRLMGWLTEGVAIAIITVVGGLFTATSTVLVALVNRANKHAKAAATDAAAVRGEVQNSHSANFREENDERHNLLVKLITGTQSDIRGIRRDNARTLDRLEAHILDDQKLAERIRRLEETRSTP